MPTEIQGLPDFEAKLSGFTERMKKLILGRTLRAALEPVRQAAVAAAPQNARQPPKSGWKAGRQPGRLKQSILTTMVRRSKLVSKDGARALLYIKRQARRGNIAGPQGLWIERGTALRRLKNWTPKPDRFGRVRRRGWRQPSRGAMAARPWWNKATAGPAATAQAELRRLFEEEIIKTLARRRSR